MNTLTHDNPKYIPQTLTLMKRLYFVPQRIALNRNVGKLDSRIRNRGKRLVAMPADKANVMQLRPSELPSVELSYGGSLPCESALRRGPHPEWYIVESPAR